MGALVGDRHHRDTDAGGRLPRGKNLPRAALGLFAAWALGTASLLAATPAQALTGVTMPDTAFGTVQFDTTATKTITITNNSGTGLYVSSLSTNDGQFTATTYPAGVPYSSQCSAGNVPSGGSCMIGVTFTPGAVGARQGVVSAGLTRTADSSTYGTVSTNLTASVVNGSFQVLPVDFGSVHVGESRNVVVELVNNGPGRMVVTDLGANDGQFQATTYPAGVPYASRCSAGYVQSGGRCSIGVSFTPSASGPRSTTLTITTRAGMFTTPLTGVGYKVGYWMMSANGTVYPFGDVANLGDKSGRLSPGGKALKLEPTASGNGYWILTSDGNVSGYGDAALLGGVDLRTLAPGESVASMSGTPSGNGYWVFSNHGRVIPFGDAKFFGDMSKVVLNGPVLGSIPTPTGNGYYMVASDGGIFAFGDATFQGSMGGRPLNAPVEAVVPIAANNGYWLVASDGGIFAFNAPFRGSMGSAHLNRPVVGMIRYGDGYLMVASDGGIFNFSDKPFLGSLGSSPPSSPVVTVGAIG